MGTLVVLIVVAGLVTLAVKSMIRDKKNGKSIQCGGECKNCGGHCH
ncbi:FeoB-associated Cys-rich membrane protein [Lacrimispora brassicae]